MQQLIEDSWQCKCPKPNTCGMSAILCPPPVWMKMSTLRSKGRWSFSIVNFLVDCICALSSSGIGEPFLSNGVVKKNKFLIVSLPARKWADQSFVCFFFLSLVGVNELWVNDVRPCEALLVNDRHRNRKSAESFRCRHVTIQNRRAGLSRVKEKR